MERYLGLDVHMASCTLVAVDQRGKEVFSSVVETNGEALVNAVRAIPGTKHLCVEEGTQSSWLVELLEREVVSIDVVVGKKTTGQKNDHRDALGLANDLRKGELGTKVFKDPHQFRALRELARCYRMVVADVTRTKNRIKSIYRARGILVSGTGVYSAPERTEWLAQLDGASRAAAELLCEQLDALLPIRDSVEDGVLQEARRHAIWRTLRTVPGLGPIRAAQLIPIIVTPNRFRTSRQFWSYCGLGIVMRSSADWVQLDGQWKRAETHHHRGLNHSSNKILKDIFKGAATSVIGSRPDHPLRVGYEHTLKNTKPSLAKVTLARKIAAITLAIWKSNKPFDPKRITNKKSKERVDVNRINTSSA